MNENSESPQDICFRDFAPAIEFVCWVVVVLVLFVRWANGPAVSLDQLVIQVTLFASALLGGVGFRLYHVFRV